MTHPKQIPHPDLKDAEKLTPLDLNSFRFDPKHTVLTPELLEQMAQQRANKQNTPQSTKN